MRDIRRCRCQRRRMTGKALRVVERRVPHDLHMRIMAGKAADAAVGTVEEFTVRQPVRLKADIGLALPTASHHEFPGAVTLAAKVGYILRSHLAKFARDGTHVSLRDVIQVVY